MDLEQPEGPGSVRSGNLGSRTPQGTRWGIHSWADMSICPLCWVVVGVHPCPGRPSPSWASVSSPGRPPPLPGTCPLSQEPMPSPVPSPGQPSPLLGAHLLSRPLSRAPVPSPGLPSLSRAPVPSPGWSWAPVPPPGSLGRPSPLLPTGAPAPGSPWPLSGHPPTGPDGHPWSGHPMLPPVPLHVVLRGQTPLDQVLGPKYVGHKCLAAQPRGPCFWVDLCPGSVYMSEWGRGGGTGGPQAPGYNPCTLALAVSRAS